MDKAPQDGRCACPRWSSPTECVRIRYGRNPTAGDPDDEPEECECPCHDKEEDDYSYSDYLDDFRAGFDRGPVGSEEFAAGVEESIHDRSERRSDEVLRYDGSERGRR